MVIKQSRWGNEFLACSGYPDCKNARDMGSDDDPDTSKEEAGVGAENPS